VRAICPSTTTISTRCRGWSSRARNGASPWRPPTERRRHEDARARRDAARAHRRRRGRLGEPVRGFQPGDFLLSKAHGRKHDIIRWGQGLRLPETDRHYAGYTHAALVISPTGDLIEAIGERVQTSTIKRYVADMEV
jgi:hypothetical protein